MLARCRGSSRSVVGENEDCESVSRRWLEPEIAFIPVLVVHIPGHAFQETLPLSDSISFLAGYSPLASDTDSILSAFLARMKTWY